MKATISKNENHSGVKNIIKSKIDIKAGNMTFFHRIELGKILTSEDDVMLKFEKTFVCLHDYRPKITEYKKLTPYFELIIDGMKHWAKVEEIMLKYEPTADEKKAGISDLSKKIGEMGTVISMAEKFSQDPDDILKWKYSKVFGLLYADLEKAKFNRKYQTILKKS